MIKTYAEMSLLTIEDFLDADLIVLKFPDERYT